MSNKHHSPQSATSQDTVLQQNTKIKHNHKTVGQERIAFQSEDEETTIILNNKSTEHPHYFAAQQDTVLQQNTKIKHNPNNSPKKQNQSQRVRRTGE